MRARLEADAGEVFGSDLKAHLDRDVVVVVAPAASLLDCAVAVANDDSAAVSAWLADGTLRRPSAEERDAWRADATRRWLAVVVRPFVLAQELHD